MQNDKKTQKKLKERRTGDEECQPEQRRNEEERERKAKER